MPLPIGELAALGAALCWAFTSLAFAAAGRRIGPTAVNVLRIFAALAVLAVIHRLLFDVWFPSLGSRATLLLGISGVVGLALGDQLLFTALVDVGPRLSSLLMAIAPPLTAIIAWPVLDEPLAWVSIGGIIVTMAGIIWVVLERPNARHAVAGGDGAANAPMSHARGVVLGAAAGACQAIGLILSKLGMGHGSDGTLPPVDPWTATLFRMAFAAAGVVVIAGFLSWRRVAAGAVGLMPARAGLGRARRRGSLVFALAMVCVGITFGPVLGVWSSMVAVDRADAGIAATLMATTPVLVLPFARWLENEHVSWCAVGGAAVAVAGVAVLAFASGRGGGS